VDVPDEHVGRLHGGKVAALLELGPVLDLVLRVDRLGRSIQHFLGDQQVVGEVGVRGQASAGESLEDLAITLHHRPQPLRNASEARVRGGRRPAIPSRLPVPGVLSGVVQGHVAAADLKKGQQGA
jgi:hypothetical protein